MRPHTELHQQPQPGNGHRNLKVCDHGNDHLLLRIEWQFALQNSGGPSIQALLMVYGNHGSQPQDRGLGRDDQQCSRHANELSKRSAIQCVTAPQISYDLSEQLACCKPAGKLSLLLHTFSCPLCSLLSTFAGPKCRKVKELRSPALQEARSPSAKGRTSAVPDFEVAVLACRGSPGMARGQAATRRDRAVCPDSLLSVWKWSSVEGVHLRCWAETGRRCRPDGCRRLRLRRSLRLRMNPGVRQRPAAYFPCKRFNDSRV